METYIVLEITDHGAQTALVEHTVNTKQWREDEGIQRNGQAGIQSFTVLPIVARKALMEVAMKVKMPMSNGMSWPLIRYVGVGEGDTIGLQNHLCEGYSQRSGDQLHAS